MRAGRRPLDGVCKNRKRKPQAPFRYGRVPRYPTGDTPLPVISRIRRPAPLSQSRPAGEGGPGRVICAMREVQTIN
jgi:hypothetical protein